MLCEWFGRKRAGLHKESWEPLGHAEYGHLIMVQPYRIFLPRILPRLKLLQDTESRILK